MAFVFKLHQDVWPSCNDIFIQNMNSIKGYIKQWIKIIRPHVKIFEQHVVKMRLFRLIIIWIYVNKQSIISWVILSVDLILYHQCIACNQYLTFWQHYWMRYIIIAGDHKLDQHCTIECRRADILKGYF